MKTLLIFLLMTLANLLWTGYCTETHDHILSIIPKTQEQVEILRNLPTEYETTLLQPVSPHYIKEETRVHLFVPANSSETFKDLLQTHAIAHEVLLENTRRLIEDQMKDESPFSRILTAFYENYHSLSDIYDWINRTHQQNPNTTEVTVIGSSFENRPIYLMKLSLSNKPNNKAIWIDCGIHAREWISPAFCLWFVHHSLTSYGHNQNITHIFDNVDVYVLPVANPDGYLYTWTTNRWWRKNRSVNNGTKCAGVDLNRNFDASWCTEGASHNPCEETYCGASPESEPESQAMANFLRKHKDSVELYLSIHSYSQMLLFPYSYTYNKTENYNDMLEMAEEAAQKIKSRYNNTYDYGSGATTIYLAPGGSDDWAYDLGIKYSFTFELQDRGLFGFLLPRFLISRACHEALIAVETVVHKVIEKTQAPASPPQIQELHLP